MVGNSSKCEGNAQVCHFVEDICFETITNTLFVIVDKTDEGILPPHDKTKYRDHIIGSLCG